MEILSLPLYLLFQFKAIHSESKIGRKLYLYLKK